MGAILEYIENNNENGYHCYKTRKLSLDDLQTDAISNENSDTDVIPIDSSGNIAESDRRRIDVVDIPQRYINSKIPWFTHFLDGSRHTYKVDDIAIGNKIYPIVAGQIVVGCCKRPSRDSFKKAALTTEIVLSLPKPFHTQGKIEDFSRFYCSKMNEYLKQKNRYAQQRENVKISKILFYRVDGKGIDPTDKNSFVNSAIEQIQNEMTDTEQLMVHELCLNKQIDDENWLIKDGSLQYNPRFSSISKEKFAIMRSNYQNVVGVSKSFNPDLLKNFEKKKMSQIIAGLKPFQRTKAYKYSSNRSSEVYAVWYVRLRREEDFRLNSFSDIVKCEMVMFKEQDSISSDTIDAISASLIREAYPVCYGSDNRWGNHLYPVYLTESFCKAQYIDSNIFLGLF